MLPALSLILLSGCAELNTLMQSVPAATPLTEAEVAEGLKEAGVIIDNLERIPGGEKMVEDVVLRINRAAGDAAKEVAPIFVNSITQMTIQDAFSILKGADNAATQYLSNTTRTDLYNLFQSEIRQSTEKDIVGGISTKESWDALPGNGMYLPTL